MPSWLSVADPVTDPVTDRQPTLRRQLGRVATGVLMLAAMLSPAAVAAAPCWSPPVEAPVIDPFRLPACPWCPGNRGLEYGTTPGATVRAVATGRVTFAGDVAGTYFLVVGATGGHRVTYGGLSPTAYSAGDIVIRGMAIGTTVHRLHLGVREGDRYVDPAPLIGRLIRRPRLIPTSGATPLPGPAPTLRCAARTAPR